MNRRKNLLRLGEADNIATEGVSAQSDMPTAETPSYEPDAIAWDEEPAPTGVNRARIISALVLLIIIGWSAAYGFVHLDEMRAGASGSLWLSWLAEWSIPPLLLTLISQLALRSSTDEQGRFANTAAMLSRESAELEMRLGTVNRELSLAREFIASQSRDLEALGRLAVERLNGSAQSLQTLITTNSAEVERISQVGETAIANMDRLRDQLPVLANAARDMTNLIGSVGNGAQEQMRQLVSGFEQLEQFGNSGERHVEMISARMAETLELFDRQANELGGMASDQFGMLQRSSEEFRNLLKTQDEEASASFEMRVERMVQFLEKRNEHLVRIEELASTGMRERLEAMIGQNDAMLRQMVERRNEATAGVNTAIEALEARLTEAIQKVAKVDEVALGNARTRLAALAEEASRIEATIGEHSASFDADLQRRRDALQQRENAALAALDERLAAFDAKVLTREEAHQHYIEGLASRAEDLAQRLASFDQVMLELRSQSETAREDIGQSAELLASRLERSRDMLAENRTAIAALSEAGGSLLELIRTSAGLADGELNQAVARVEQSMGAFQANAEGLRALVESAEARSAALAEHVEHAREHGSSTLGLIERLDTQLTELAAKSASLTGQTREELQGMFDLFSASSADALANLRHGQAEAIAEIATQIAEKSNSAIAAALGEHALGSIAEIEASARAASTAGRETVGQLRDQLAAVNQLTANLEQRVSAARQRAEEQHGDDFARRMALITEALNSGAIDIAKAFDNDVADTQWANYLRGDRGIFTRRAVRLLDKSQARAILDYYEADSDFRETVNRYIHDFEAMLRSVLSTRDGNAMAVTLLSSDVGKLYVCLAQAIERLRG